MKAMLSAAFVVLANSAHAQVDPDAWLRNWEDMAVREWAFDARVCMSNAISAQLMYGNRDRDKIYAVVMPACGAHISRVMSMRGANGREFADGLFEREVARFPELRRERIAGQNTNYVISVGAFSNAEPILARLVTGEIPHYAERIATSKGTITRVRAGPFANRELAEKARNELARLGFRPSGVIERNE